LRIYDDDAVVGAVGDVQIADAIDGERVGIAEGDRTGIQREHDALKRKIRDGLGDRRDEESG